MDTTFDPELFGVSQDELLEYRTYCARMDRLQREAAYQASLPKVPTINIESEEQFIDLIHCYANGQPLFSCAEALALVGMYLESQGNPAFAGFGKNVRLPLPPGFPTAL